MGSSAGGIFKSVSQIAAAVSPVLLVSGGFNLYTEAVEIPGRTGQVMENVKNLPNEQLDIIKENPELSAPLEQMSLGNARIQQLQTSGYFPSMRTVLFGQGPNATEFIKFNEHGMAFAEAARKAGIVLKPVEDPAIIANKQQTWNQYCQHNQRIEPNC